MNILAGYALCTKNPKQAPANAMENIDIQGMAHLKAIKPKNERTIRVTPEAKPSSPSVRFTLLTVPTTTNTIKGM